MVNLGFDKSDLNSIHGVVQNTMNIRAKELILFSLRDFFSQDTIYKYVVDHFGYAKTVDMTGLELDAGINDDFTTRLCIQEAYRMEADFYPAIIVKAGGFSSVPISFNRESGSVQWDNMIFQDGYGNIKTFKYPQHFIFAGAWDGTINIDILARDARARDDLTDLVSNFFVAIVFDELVKEGVIVTGVSSAGANESDDRTHKLYRDTVSLKIRTEWRRHIKVGNIIEVLNTAIDFGQVPDGIVAANLTINTEQTLLELLKEL